MADKREVVGRHKGGTFLVMGNGPSINTLPDQEEIPEGIITIGMNLIGLKYYPHYYIWLDQVSLKKEPIITRTTAAMAEEAFCPFPEGKKEIEAPFPVTHFGRYRPPRDTMTPILSEKWPDLFWSRTTTFAAINLVVLMGAARIGLIGVDMDKYPHFYDGYHINPGNNHKPEQEMGSKAIVLRTFDLLAKYAERKGIEIVNLNPESAVRCFPFVTLGEL